MTSKSVNDFAREKPHQSSSSPVSANSAAGGPGIHPTPWVTTVVQSGRRSSWMTR